MFGSSLRRVHLDRGGLILRRSLILAGLALLWWLLAVSPALADPPGPTDYKSEVVEIEPAVAGIEVEIIGGDSFVLLTVESGIAVEVAGYDGEPYLRFPGDGTVEENRNAPSKYINEDRFGRTELPEGVDASAVPEWEIVSGGGSFAWHDHRTHWMNPAAPPGGGPGDTVAEGVIPLLVDGAEVDVTVVSVWQPAPSLIPVVAGFWLGLIAALAVVRWQFLAGSMLLGLAAAALATGSAAYLSVPGETQPPWSLFVFPLVSFLIAIAVAYPKRWGQWGELVHRRQSLLVLVAAFELMAWGFLHWSWLWRAILPTSLPFWLDRAVAASVLIGAAGVAVAALQRVARSKVSAMS